MTTANKQLEVFLVNDFGDRYLYSVNRSAFNRIGSDSLFASTYGEKLLEEYQLNVLVGTDSGLLPRYVAKCGVPTGSRFVFIELPEILELLGQESVLDDLPPEITVTTVEGFLKNPEELNFNNYAFLDAVRVQESMGSLDANLPEYRHLSWNLNIAINKMLHTLMVVSNSFPFIMRQLENLTENQTRFSDVLQDAFKGRTAVILAGGPSLNEALPWVRENRDRLLVIAVSRISRTLSEAGIVPHIVTSVDPFDLSFEISREMLSLAELPDPPLFIGSFHVSPLLAGQWAAKALYTGIVLPWSSPLNAERLGYNGPTVSNFALSLGMHMGCGTIVLAGVNLCYAADGRTHAAGSNESKVGPDLGQLSTRVETYEGGHAETNQGFAAALSTLQRQAQELAARGINIYNCSLNAAKVPDIEYKPLEQIELSACEVTPSDVINRRVPESTRKTRLAHYRRVKKEISNARNKFQEILNLANEALRCSDGLFGRNGMQRDFRHKIRMDKIERRLDRSLRRFSVLVKQFGRRRFLLSLKHTIVEEMTDEQMETATREYYETYVEGTEFLINCIDKVLQRIESRIEEEQESPDLEKLSAQWENDRQCGRVHILRRRNPEKMQRLTKREADTVKRLEQEFTRVMTEDRTSHVVHIEQNHDLKHTRSKALLLFKRKEITDLEAMVQGLVGHPDQEKAAPYLHFVNGLIDELNGRPAEAIDNYQMLFTDPPHYLTEDALLQVVHISLALQDAGSALLAVECLLAISPTYLTAYAELLKAVGRFEDAFQAYNRYVGLAPNDLGALISLGMLCKEAGLTDAAQELFNRVLEKDPQNRAALSMLEVTATASQG
jgi:hypothetical protein